MGSSPSSKPTASTFRAEYHHFLKHWYPSDITQDMVITRKTPQYNYLYCCTVHLVDSLNITLPTNALIVCHLF